MAFTVEDGTGLTGSNAYVSVAYVDAYFLDRNNTAWVGTTAQKQAAIIKATDFIEARWGSRFLGQREFYGTPQALSFPRSRLRDRSGQYVTGIPEKLKQACAQYAIRALTTNLIPDPEISDSGLQVVSKREKVGPLEEETVYQATGAAPTLLRPYPEADRLLQEYVSAAGTNYR